MRWPESLGRARYQPAGHVDRPVFHVFSIGMPREWSRWRSAGLKYKRLLLKLSGEALMGKQSYGIDMSVADRLANDIAADGRCRAPRSPLSSAAATFSVV